MTVRRVVGLAVILIVDAALTLGAIWAVSHVSVSVR